MSFGGTRTAHQLGCGLEDAGLEIRDTIDWIYAQGFPKNLNVATAIRKAFQGTPLAARADAWEGWGTALKPAREPILITRKPLRGTVAANVIAHHAGALHIDAARTGSPGGRWPANAVFTHAPGCTDDSGCLPGCPVAELTAQTGTAAPAPTPPGATATSSATSTAVSPEPRNAARSGPPRPAPQTGTSRSLNTSQRPVPPNGSSFPESSTRPSSHSS